MKRALLTGMNGQLGTFIRKIGMEYPDLEIIPRSREQLNLAELTTIQEKVIEIRPDVIINAAAYTHVDKAETDKELAMLINGDAVGELAKAADAIGATLIQISTDYVFNGRKETAYLPDDATDPINHYGFTKLEGERLAQKYCKNAVVVRTSWVHSNQGKNFETTMRRLMTEHKELRVINDQKGRPTNAADLAKYCLDLVNQSPLSSRVLHFAGPRVMSWYDLALDILESIEYPVTEVIHPIATSDYPTPAKRPMNSVLEIDSASPLVQ